MTQIWNAGQYAQRGRFVANLATGVFDLLAPQPGERILDLGCGDGVLTAKIAATGASVLGVDASPTMVEAARARGLDVRQLGAEQLPFQAEFDAVFSNAALHWIRDQQAVLAGVHRSLKPGGRFVAEMGGFGNIAAIRVALAAVFSTYGLAAEALDHSYFPTPESYSTLLQAAQFTVETIDLIPRMTPLPPPGMSGWLETFRNGLLDQLPEEHRRPALEKTVALLEPVLCTSSGDWIADYVRLRFQARASAP